MVEKINAENALERQILADNELIEGLQWGKPRPGHPEGKVIYHVNEVLKNVNRVTKNQDYRAKLRLIAIIHDTFKHKVDTSKPRFGENHHAMIARRFAEKYITDPIILDIIELHDEAYNAWQTAIRRGRPYDGEARALRLAKRLGRNLDLYMKFYICDTYTGDKEDDSLQWFMTVVEY